jgi:5'(3')-deoxyribonucleotidase
MKKREKKMGKPAKKIVYLDMDDVLVDFRSGIEAVKADYPTKDPESREANWDEVPDIFSKMEPLNGAIEAVKILAASPKLDVYVLSTAPWENPSAWSDKLNWIRKHFDEENPIDDKTKDNPLYKKVILSHNKHLNAGAFLIDDRKANGAEDFGGFHIHFGAANEEHERDGRFSDWKAVLEHFADLKLIDPKDILDLK